MLSQRVAVFTAEDKGGWVHQDVGYIVDKRFDGPNPFVPACTSSNHLPYFIGSRYILR